MYVLNGIAYAGEPIESIKVKSLKVIDHLYLLLTFSTGEKRIYDATELLQYPVYKPLANRNVFKQAYIEGGTVVWENGDKRYQPYISRED